MSPHCISSSFFRLEFGEEWPQSFEPDCLLETDGVDEILILGQIREELGKFISESGSWSVDIPLKRLESPIFNVVEAVQKVVNGVCLPPLQPAHEIPDETTSTTRSVLKRLIAVNIRRLECTFLCQIA